MLTNRVPVYQVGFIICFVACLREIPEIRPARTLVHVCLLMSLCVCVWVCVCLFPHQSNPAPTSRTLPLARHVIPSWVESFLYASVKAVGLDRLPTTVKHGCERHAVISVVLEVFFRRFFSLSSDKKNRLEHLPRTSWTRGLWICFRACPFLGSWRALLCEEAHIIAERDCSVFWRIDDWGISLQESCTGEMFYAVRSGQLAGSPRLGRL